jgi:hypothetical protein
LEKVFETTHEEPELGFGSTTTLDQTKHHRLLGLQLPDQMALNGYEV